MEHVWVWQVIQAAGTIIGLWLAITKKMDARFQTRDDRITKLEEGVMAHWHDDARIHSTNTQRILTIEQGCEERERMIQMHDQAVTRLDAQRDEMMRILHDMREDIKEVSTKQTSLMDTMASVLLKIGK